MSDQKIRPKRRARKPRNQRPSSAHQTPPAGSRLARLKEIIGSFPRRKVMVVGDFIADVYLYGKPFQLSREAPVVVIRHEWDNVVPGGAGNATYNLAHLGCRVYAVGMLGNDELGNKLTAYLKERRVQVEGLVLSHIVNTTSKTRIMAGDDHTSKQQVIRIDRINREAIPARLQERLSEQFHRLAKAVDAIIVSDYGYGVASGPIITGLQALAKEKIVVVDSRYQLMRFRGVTAVTPNESEAEKATRLRLAGDREVERAARILREKLGLKAVLITRGNRGMTLLEKPHKALHIPIVGPDDIIDVTGAGDTVATVFTLALASGADFHEAAILANYAASIVVMKTGTAVATPAELLEVVERNNEGSENPA